MPSALLLDLGGVLLNVDFSRAYRALALASGQDEPTVEMAILKDGLKDGHDRGDVDSMTFHREICRRLGTILPFDEFVRAWTSIFQPMEAALEALGPLSQRFGRLYCLSNTDPLHVGWVARHCPWWHTLQGHHLSYQVRCLKPHPAFYRGALRRFGLAAAEALFADDRLENVEGARAVGIPSLHVQSPQDLWSLLA